MILAVDFQGGIENAWSNVATFLPKLAAALVILVIGYEERGPELRQQARASAAQAQPDRLYGDGRTAEYPSTQGASATDLYDTGSGQGSRLRRDR